MGIRLERVNTDCSRVHAGNKHEDGGGGANSYCRRVDKSDTRACEYRGGPGSCLLVVVVDGVTDTVSAKSGNVACTGGGYVNSAGSGVKKNTSCDLGGGKGGSGGCRGVYRDNGESGRGRSRKRVAGESGVFWLVAEVRGACF